VANAPTEQARRWAEDDGWQGVRLVRQRAGEWGIDQRRIGFIGFSAGGGIAVNAALEGDAESRPDFVGGIYAGYRLATSMPRGLPPLFLAIADDGDGGHGFGANTLGRLSDRWRDLFRGWLAGRGYLSPPSKYYKTGLARLATAPLDPNSVRAVTAS
jgi:acetyl esterase/lipase